MPDPTAPMIVAVEMVAMIACLTWIGVSVVRSARHIGAVQRRRAHLVSRQDTLKRDLDSARHALRQEEETLRQTNKSLKEREGEIDALQAQLEEARRNGAPEYRVLTERFGEKDRLWLLTVPQPGRPERWAVAAPDAGTATALLTGKVTSPERPVVDGQLV